MKKYWMVIIIVILLSSCAPSPEKIEEAIEQTQIAKEKSITSTPSHTNTPAATNTPEPTNTPTATNTPKTELGTFSNPFPFKRRVGLTMTSEGKEISFEFRIDEVIRGEDAWSIIKQANMFNDPPPDGYEAILIKIYVKNISSAGFLILEFFDLSLATKGNV